VISLGNEAPPSAIRGARASDLRVAVTTEEAEAPGPKQPRVSVIAYLENSGTEAVRVHKPGLAGPVLEAPWDRPTACP
jgi:hypothetical protein